MSENEKPVVLPSISTEQMRELDRLMIESYGITLLQMMENAGRNLAEQAVRMLAHLPEGANKVLVLCGAGNNGGGGFVAARHLHNRGLRVDLQLVAPANKLKPVPAHQWAILQKLGFEGEAKLDLSQYDLIIDAMIGYGLTGDPRQPVADWIEGVNESGVEILSLDAPSGLDTSTGQLGNPCIQAAATLTLALPKLGLSIEQAASVVGKLYVADISVPPELYQQMGLAVPASSFSRDSILQIG
jgi:NAD(P)H-hydrate epimerase